MRRFVKAGAVLAATLALALGGGSAVAQQANEAHGGASETDVHPGNQGATSADAREESTADYILHHVSDSKEYEFEVPLSYNHKTVHLPEIFVPLKAGACEPAAGAVADSHGVVARPGLGAGCLDLSITKHTAFMFLAAFLLILVMLTATHRDRRQLVPRGTWANVFESLVLFVRDELAVKNIGKEYGPRYTPFLLTIFFFILAMNILGLFPWSATATANLAVTAGLAIIVFFVTQYASIKAAGLGTYLAHLTGGVPWPLWPIMIPVELLGLFTKPFALTVRLFANMLAGHIVIFFLLGLIFMLKSALLAFVSVPFAFAIYLLEIFVAFVQAYVFTMLSSLFIGMGVAMAHHHGDHGSHDAHDGHDHAHGQAAGSHLSGG
jgi:F-type H+-transporting ATPase subunit a